MTNMQTRCFFSHNFTQRRENHRLCGSGAQETTQTTNSSPCLFAIFSRAPRHAILSDASGNGVKTVAFLADLRYTCYGSGKETLIVVRLEGRRSEAYTTSLKKGNHHGWSISFGGSNSRSCSRWVRGRFRLGGRL